MPGRDATTRRSFLTIAGAGLAGIVESAPVAAAPDPTPAERTNMKIVTDFCEAFSADDVDRIMSFMADPCSYRVTEAMEPIKGLRR